MHCISGKKNPPYRVGKAGTYHGTKPFQAPGVEENVEADE
jgi:hypothetical protein